jgi:hypothetical protein
MTEHPESGQQASSTAATPASRSPAVTPCSTCGHIAAPAGNQDQPQAMIAHVHSRVTAVGTVNAAFPSLAVEKKFAQLLGHRDFKGFTDRETMHSVLVRRENRNLAWQMCFTHTPYNAGPSPAYVLWPQHSEDLEVLVDTLTRSPSTSEFDVVEGTIQGYAPPEMCNGQQIPLLVFSQLTSFSLETFTGSMPRPKGIEAEKFNAAVDETFHRALREASNATGPRLGLTFAVLQYAGFYHLVAEKFGENSALTGIEVSQAPKDPDRADIRLRFEKRDTGFREVYCFAVNYGGPFDYLEELLHPCIDISVS